MTPLNILLHSWAYFPNGGGVGAYFFNMAKALAEYGHNVTVLTGQAAGLPEIETNHNLTVLRKYSAEDIGTKKVLALALDTIDRYSIDFVEGADYLGDCARLLREKKRPPVLIKVHGCNILDVVYESQVFSPWQRPLIKAALLRSWRLTLREKQSITQADFLAAPSLRIFQELEKQGISLHADRLVIPNPIPIENGEFIAEAPFPTLLLVARLDIGKGIQYLPTILRQLVAEFPEMVVEIAGGDSYARGLGYLRNWLMKEAGEVAYQFSFLGHLSKKELELAYQRSWVVILPSRWDNFPTVVLEAMSHCKPVVASPHGGMVEMLAETLCNTALPDTPVFSEEIARLLRDDDLRKDAGVSMYKKARKRYAPDVIAAAYTSFVGHVLSGQ